MKLKRRTLLSRALAAAAGYISARRVQTAVVAAVLVVFALAAIAGAVGFREPQAQPAALKSSAAREKRPLYDPPVDFAALIAQNPDTVGWMSAPLLGIEEPVLQSGDNAKYLDTSFEGEHSEAGAVFIDYACDPSLAGRHTVIYGHNLSAGGKFTPLTALKDEREFERCRDDITLYTPERAIPLRLAGVEAAEADAMRRTTLFLSRAEFSAFAHSLISGCDITRETGACSALYSFITCSYEGEGYRTYIYAVEREGGE